jgi:bifunctional DNA-binding transcriptional regulator/antitoxin component of YhaV-PrlF toxin-antitoxin module
MPSGKINGMKVHLDKSGRIVLPKPLRQRLGLRTGTSFYAVPAADGVLLRTVKQEPSLIERDGFLVHTGKAGRDFNWEQLRDDLQQERAAEILGF